MCEVSGKCWAKFCEQYGWDRREPTDHRRFCGFPVGMEHLCPRFVALGGCPPVPDNGDGRKPIVQVRMML